MSAAIEFAGAAGEVQSGMVGQSAVMQRLRATIATVAPTRLSVLIEGPTGAGKELVAAAIHAQSGRGGAFVPFNVCAISDTMFEDALFGHVRGAFTGAHQDVEGYLREANGGTAFMDEISGLPLGHQAKLLRALETGTFRPVGARRDVRTDFRLVAASNEKMNALVGSNGFRADLLHRIAAVRVKVPSLAERVDDIPLLARHFLLGIGGPVHIKDDVLRALASHGWPGNVRELKHVIESGFVLGGGRLTLDGLRHAMDQPVHHCRADMSDERRRLLDSLEANAWNTESAAQALGIHRATLYRRMKQLGIPLRRGAWKALPASGEPSRAGNPKHG